MDFEFTDEQKMVKDMARKLMEKEIIPIADEYDRTKALMDRKKLKELRNIIYTAKKRGRKNLSS